MLLENINSNIEDMIKMASNIQTLSLRCAQTEAQNRNLRNQVRQLRERNDQMSLSILQDQAKISKMSDELESSKKDVKEYLQMVEDLRQMNKSLEEKNDEMVKVIKELREANSGEEVKRGEEGQGNSFFVSVKKEKKISEGNYDTNIRESKVIPSGNPMAQTRKFLGGGAKEQKKDKKGEGRLPKGIDSEIREMLTDSSKTSKAENKVEEKRPVRNKSQTQPGLLNKEEAQRSNVYNSHRPDSTLNSLKGEMSLIDKIRSRSKPMKTPTTSDLRNKYQALRSQQKVKLYKRLNSESKDIEKRLKLASKSPRRENYLGLEQKEGKDLKSLLESAVDGKEERKTKLEELISSYSKQHSKKEEGLVEGEKKEKKKRSKKKASRTKENTMRSEKQWLSNRVDHHSQGRRRKRNQSSSIQNAKFKNKKPQKNEDLQINPNEAEIKLSWLLRVREEMSMKHVQTYNFLKKWFGKIFINGSNSQSKFYRTFKQYLMEEENIFFLCFGQNKSGKTFSIQGKDKKELRTTPGCCP